MIGLEKKHTIHARTINIVKNKRTFKGQWLPPANGVGRRMGSTFFFFFPALELIQASAISIGEAICDSETCCIIIYI